MKSRGLSGAVRSLDKSAPSLSRESIMAENINKKAKPKTAIPGTNMVVVRKLSSPILRPRAQNITRKPAGIPSSRPVDIGSRHISLKFLMAKSTNLILLALFQ